MDDYSELDAICAQLDLPAEERLAVSRAVHDLQNLPSIKSGPARLRELDAIEQQTKALQATLRELDVYNRMDMHLVLDELGFPGPLLDRDGTIRNPHPFQGTYALLEMLGQAARRVKQNAPPLHQRVGRPTSRHLHAVVVANLQFAVCRPGRLAFGRGGDFQRLCDAVFAAAGVPSSSSGAITYLQQWRTNADHTRSLLRGE